MSPTQASAIRLPTCSEPDNLFNKLITMSKIDIAELAKHCPDVTISIKVGDLMEANKQLVENVRISLEKQIRDEHEEKYLSSDDVCKMLNISKPTLWRWEKLDYLIPIRVGGKVRYKSSEVKQILNTSKRGGLK